MVQEEIMKLSKILPFSILLCLILIATSIPLSGCSKLTGRLRDIYATIYLNNFEEGQGNSWTLTTGSEGFFIVAFADTVVDRQQIRVEVKKKGEAELITAASAETAGFHVTYAIPIQPLPAGTYDLTVIYGGSTLNRELVIENDSVLSFTEEFDYLDPLIPPGRPYSIYSDKKDTAFRSNVEGKQTLSVEVPATSSNWYRLKWIFVGDRKSGDFKNSNWYLIKEINAYTEEIKDGKGILKAEIQPKGESWLPGTYRVELYQDIYHEPVDVIFVDLLASAESSKAAASEEAAPAEQTAPAEQPAPTPAQPAPAQPPAPAPAQPPTPAPAHTVAENKVFMTSGLGADGRNLDVVTRYPVGIKTPLYTVAVTDYPEGTTLSFGMKHETIGNLTNAAEVVKGPAIGGKYYTLASFKLYNPETDNWPPGTYQVVLYKNGDPVTQSTFEIN